MREWFANRIHAALAVRRDGVSLPPTADLGVRLKQEDGQEVVLLSQGDSFDLVCGKDTYYVHHLTPRTALRLAWFVLWRWWARGTWFGWKLSAWQWATETKLDERAMRESAALHKRRRVHADKSPQARPTR